MNDGKLHRDPQSKTYLQDLDAQIDALEARLGAARESRDEVQRALDAYAPQGVSRSQAVGDTAQGSRLPLAGMLGGGRRWAIGAAGAVLAVGAGLTFGGGGAPNLPNAISLQDRIPVAEAADAPALGEINVVPAPMMTVDASDSPFDDASTSAGVADVASPDSLSFNSPDSPDVGSIPSSAPPPAGQLTPFGPQAGSIDSIDSPDDSLNAPAFAGLSTDSASVSPDGFTGPAPYADSVSDSPDDVFIAPSAPPQSGFGGGESASDSPETPGRFQGWDSPDSSDSVSFDSPDNT